MALAMADRSDIFRAEMLAAELGSQPGPAGLGASGCCLGARKGLDSGVWTGLGGASLSMTGSRR